MLASWRQAMKISTALTKSVNEQIREEFESAYLYLSMSAWFHSQDLPGFAHWMSVQYHEELVHGEKMFAFLVDRDATPEVSALKKPLGTWKSALDAFEAAYAHEQHITACIYKIVEQARKEGDLATELFYQWFVKEQIEEEATALGLVKQLKHIGNDSSGVFLLDRELAQRLEGGDEDED